jgi:hypothetical protein
VAAAAALVMSAPLAAEPDNTVRVAARSYKLAPDEFKAYAAIYTLANGRSVQFSRNFHHYYVELRGEEAAELYAVAPAVFVTAAGARIEFLSDGAGVRIEHYERLPMAVALAEREVVMVAGR